MNITHTRKQTQVKRDKQRKKNPHVIAIYLTADTSDCVKRAISYMRKWLIKFTTVRELVIRLREQGMVSEVLDAY